MLIIPRASRKVLVFDENVTIKSHESCKCCRKKLSATSINHMSVCSTGMGKIKMWRFSQSRLNGGKAKKDCLCERRERNEKI